MSANDYNRPWTSSGRLQGEGGKNPYRSIQKGGRSVRPPSLSPTDEGAPGSARGVARRVKPEPVYVHSGVLPWGIHSCGNQVGNTAA